MRYKKYLILRHEREIPYFRSQDESVPQNPEREREREREDQRACSNGALFFATTHLEFW